mmetsp:Transcript_40166/g.63539  ORF Transcript_40166/g.63539 Transcript_40166/m.63539 type:complete len:231 (+) Transcript_40166:1-693(+)
MRLWSTFYYSAMTPEILLFFSEDSNLARVDVTTLPQQTLMEMVVDGFENKGRLFDDDGCYLDVDKWTGVTVNANAEVHDVDWRDYQDRHFPEGGTLELRWLPGTVVGFALTGSEMHGTVEIGRLPEVMERLYLQRNWLSGTIDLPLMPRPMIYLILHTNRFHGPLNLQNIPDTLTDLLLNSNSFSGTVRIGELPDIISVYIGGNPKIEALVDKNEEVVTHDRIFFDVYGR